jgi:hypothetical protein
MNTHDEIQRTRSQKRAELLKLGLRPVLVARSQQVRFPDLSLEEMRQRLIHEGEDPDFIEVWKEA